MTYSMDFRETVLRHIDKSASTEAVSKLFSQRKSKIIWPACNHWLLRLIMHLEDRLNFNPLYLERYYKARHRALFEPLYQQILQVNDETNQTLKQWLLDQPL